MADPTHPALLDPALADAPAGPLLFAAHTVRRGGRAGPRRTPRHQHARGQLLGADSGLMQIDVGATHWLLPAGHLAWIPPDLPHALLAPQGFEGWSLYFNAAASALLPDQPGSWHRGRCCRPPSSARSSGRPVRWMLHSDAWQGDRG